MVGWPSVRSSLTPFLSPSQPPASPALAALFSSPPSQPLPAQASIRLSDTEATWLRTRCPFFKPAYIAFLAAFRFDPAAQVRVEFVPESTDSAGVEWGAFEIAIKGKWAETILWEVPLMAIISEAYFTTVDKAWDYVGQLGQLEVRVASGRRG